MDVWYDGSHAISFYRYGTYENPIGALIGHTWKDWGLVPTSRPLVNPPDQKTSTIEIQGADGDIDISEALTKWPLYKNRTGSWKFLVTDYNDYDDRLLDNNDSEILDNVDDPIRASVAGDWATMYTKLLNLLHGKLMVIILDDDPDFYYKGRFKISQWISSNDGSLSGLTIDYNLFPYKMKKEFIEIDLCETAELDILSGRQPVIPEIKSENVSGSTSAKTVALHFTNPELDVDIDSFSFVSGSKYSDYQPLENMSGSYDFTLTNIFGTNHCTLTASIGEAVTHVYFRYRKGEL